MHALGYRTGIPWGTTRACPAVVASIQVQVGVKVGRLSLWLEYFFLERERPQVSLWLVSR